MLSGSANIKGDIFQNKKLRDDFYNISVLEALIFIKSISRVLHLLKEELKNQNPDKL